MKKRSEETQTLRAGCSNKAEPKIFAPPQTPPGGEGRPKFNQLEIFTTFTYKPSLVRIDALNRVIVVTDPPIPQTGPITIHCAAVSAQYNKPGLPISRTKWFPVSDFLTLTLRLFGTRNWLVSVFLDQWVVKQACAADIAVRYAALK